jgi:hypothetical protein
MLSRVANSIYWMCRYIERAENVARFISVNLNLLLDFSPLPGPFRITGGFIFNDNLHDSGYCSTPIKFCSIFSGQRNDLH